MIGKDIFLLTWFNNILNILIKLLMVQKYKLEHLKFSKQNNVIKKIFALEKKKKTVIINY
jgi:hypothetical protein